MNSLALSGEKQSGLSSSFEIFKLENRSHLFPIKLWSLTFDLPGEKVNKFDRRVMLEFERLLGELQQKSGSIDVLVLFSAKPGIFIAGADIKLIQAAKTAKEATDLAQAGQHLLNLWEDLPFPTVVAIDGATMGGGCELSLASTAILMSKSSQAKIGLPEVLLGVLPGMGGCVRLPRRVGIAGALDMILTGKTLNGERAYRTGLADAVLEKENFNSNVEAWVVKNAKALRARVNLARPPKLGGMGGIVGKLLESPLFKGIVFSQAKKGVLKQTRGHYPAPLKAIETVRRAGTTYGARLSPTRRARALAIEAEAFGALAETEISKNLIRLFFMTEDTKKSNGLPSGRSVDVVDVERAGVLGAGVMGGGIAQLFASKNVITWMKDLNVAALTTGIQSANKIFVKLLKRRRLNPREYQQKLNLIAPALDYSAFRSTEMIVEAVVEDMGVKQKVLADLENHISSDCVVASNTSSLSISEMQKALKRPERFAGMHFFNPVAKMPLIEVIRGEKSSDEAVATTFVFSKKLGKTPIVVKDAPGFLVNRLLMPYLNEAVFLVSEGVPIDEIDSILLKFGMPMGPMELIDEVGVDVAVKVAKILHHAFGPRMTPAPLNDRVVSQGRLGKKNGKGLYVYEGQGERLKKNLDPAIYQVIGVTPKPRAVSSEEIIDRCTLAMINEAARCLEEKIVEDASQVDLGMIMGTGFPPFRGGLMRYADSLGLEAIVKKLEHYAKKAGPRFEPAPALVQRLRNRQPFYPS